MHSMREPVQRKVEFLQRHVLFLNVQFGNRLMHMKDMMALETSMNYNEFTLYERKMLSGTAIAEVKESWSVVKYWVLKKPTSEVLSKRAL